MCWKFDVPAIIADFTPEEMEQRVVLGEEQCVVDDEHFFILANLDIPIQGSIESLRWTVWGSLSKKNFERASDLWESRGREREPAYFSWLSNQIPGYSASINIKALVHTLEVGVRPRIEVIEEGHALTHDQRDGITPERADELIHESTDPGDT